MERAAGLFSWAELTASCPTPLGAKVRASIINDTADRASGVARPSGLIAVCLSVVAYWLFSGA